MDKAKKFIRFFLGLPLTILSFLFIAKIFLDNRITIMTAVTGLNPLLFLLGIFFFSLFFAVKSFVWIEILNKRGFVPPIRRTLFFYSFSEIKRYIPGSIFAFLGRMNTLSENVPQKETLKGIGIEALLLALSALVISLPAISYPLFKAREQTSISTNAIIGISTLLALVIGTFIFSRFKKTILSYFDSFLLFLLGWSFYALGCFFIGISITYIYPSNFVFILSFFVLSWLAGYLFFIAPMGLGIRELLVTGSLSLFLPASFASIIALLTRVGMVLGELLYLFATYTFFKLKNSSRLLRINPYMVIVLFTGLVYFIFFTSYTILRHEAFISGRFDLGNMSQTVWNTAHGHFFMLTNPDGVGKISRLADHSDILLVLFAPLYYIWSDPRVLLIIQSLSLAIGGVIVFLLAKEILKYEKLALILSLSFYFNFWIHEENIFDFHAVTIGTTLLLATIYFLIKKRYILFSLFLVLSVMTKENVFLVASVFGLYLLFKEKRWIQGILLTIIPSIIFFYLISRAIPGARGNAHFALSYYSYLGASTKSIVATLLLKPQVAFGHLLSFSSLNYLHQLLIPTGYLALASPLYLIFALPELTIYLLSDNAGLRSYQYHYGAIILPFIYISTIYGAAFILKKFNNGRSQKFLFYYLLACLLFSVYFYSPLPGMLNADYGPFVALNTRKINDYLAVIPKTASVSSSNNIGAHLSHREDIFVIPNAITTADYVVLYGEKKATVKSIDLQKYDILVSDAIDNFYMYKKKTLTPCATCLP